MKTHAFVAMKDGMIEYFKVGLTQEQAVKHWEEYTGENWVEHDPDEFGFSSNAGTAIYESAEEVQTKFAPLTFNNLIRIMSLALRNVFKEKVKNHVRG